MRQRRSFGSSRLGPALGAAAVVVAFGLGFLVGAPPETAVTRDSGPEIADKPVATFSIVARDPETGDLGIAVQSRFFAVGAVVPWARAGVGAVATQSWANTAYGPRGLDLLADGSDAEATMAALIADDEGAAQRQVGIVGADGSTATFTGDACLPWAGGRTGEHYAAQGNILAGPEVIDAMAAAFEGSSGELPDRLLKALAAGQAAGGDARGMQSAALLVVRGGGGYSGFNDRWVDLRVDDHPAPIAELQRLLDLRNGERAGARAARLLGEGDTVAAVAAAEHAVRLLPDEGSAWMTLARSRLAAGDATGAADAASTAIARDPWIKTAVLRGLMRIPELEELLRDARFSSLWAALPAQQ